MKLQADEMLSWCNVSWWNGKLMKCLVDEMLSWWKAKLMKW